MLTEEATVLRKGYESIKHMEAQAHELENLKK